MDQEVLSSMPTDWILARARTIGTFLARRVEKSSNWVEKTWKVVGMSCPSSCWQRHKTGCSWYPVAGDMWEPLVNLNLTNFQCEAAITVFRVEQATGLGRAAHILALRSYHRSSPAPLARHRALLVARRP